MDDQGETKAEPYRGAPKLPYSRWDCRRQLLVDFDTLYARDIDDVITFVGPNYSSAYKALNNVMKTVRERRAAPVLKGKYNFRNRRKSEIFHPVPVVIENDLGVSTVLHFTPMVTSRRVNKQRRDTAIPEGLRPEVERMRKLFSVGTSDRNTVCDRETTRRPPNQKSATPATKADMEEPPNDSLIECACCFGDCEFEKMAQCSEGHLVCINCLQSYTREAVFGAGKIDLHCTAADCTAFYPISELRRCLPNQTLKKYEEKALDDNLRQAAIENLVKCPHCDYAAELSPRIKVLECANDACLQATCRDCKTNWVEHKGLSCDEIEQKDETALRKKYEEKMTEAKVRTCSKCFAQFTKDKGCNKMICRCGMSMCYICRKSKITYKHFCQHVRNPGEGCKTCNNCSLWTNPEEDDERAIAELQKEGQEKKKTLGYNEKIVIGMPDEKTVNDLLGETEVKSIPVDLDNTVPERRQILNEREAPPQNLLHQCIKNLLHFTTRVLPSQSS
ncbi:E3 ubiquitin-protein ligase RNF216 [Aplysia californica]|uniref:E3 ubiquitin-protein ligase RNF216 n=1 Tax=Aplysia californica TaxID=6500 RepID=A0ABM0ZWF7_APLCA|nr:E3 ubiquitin-protein ligase RNF216 [Aplysia californica]